MQRLLIAGVDEAGRGPLAGPVYAAAVVLDSTKPISGIKDSKLLTPKKRAELSKIICERAKAWSVSYVDVEIIDKINILQATLLAMKQAIYALNLPLDYVLIDGNQQPEISFLTKTIIKGDQKIPVIGAASILAKVMRDKKMLALDNLYPNYGFAQHKGYGTQAHLLALKKYGPTVVHRLSFKPLKEI